jgi:type VI protein secretion system component Hcp
MAVDGLLVVLDQQNQVVQSESAFDWYSNNRVLATWPSGPTFAAVQAADKQPHGAFEIEDFDFGSEFVPGAGSAATSKVTFDPLAITMKLDKATSLFFQNLAGHTAFNSVDLVLNKSTGGDTGGGPYCVLGFGTVVGQTLTMSHDDESPKVSMSFSYQQMQIAYRQQKPDGSFDSWVVRGWDRKANTAI